MVAVRWGQRGLALGLLMVGFASVSPAQQVQNVRLSKLAPLPLPSETPDPLPADARYRIGSLRFRDGGQIYGAAVSPDGRTLAVSSPSAYVRILELATGKELRRFSVPGGFRSNLLQFTGDGRQLITFGYNGTGFWSVETGKAERNIPQDPARPRDGQHAISANGSRVAVITPDYNASGKAVVIDLGENKELCEVTTLHNNALFGALSPDGTRLVTWGNYYNRNPNGNPNPENHNGTAQLWDCATGKELGRLKSEAMNLVGCRFSPDSRQLLTAGNGVIQLWDVATQRAVRRFASRASQGQLMAFSGDGKTLYASSSRDSTIQSWDLAGGKRLGTHEGPPQTVPTGLSVREDGQLIAWGVSGSLVHVWEVTTGRSLTPSTGHSAGITGLTFADGGRTLVSAGQDGKMFAWDAATGREKSAAQPREEGNENRRYYRGARGGFASNGYPTSALFSPDGRYMIGSNAEYGTPSIFELPSGVELFALQSPQQPVDRNGPAVFSPDSTKVAALSRYASPQRQGIPLWDLETGLPLPLLKGQGGEYTAGAFSRDGRRFVSASTNFNGNGSVSELWVWDLSTGKEVAKLSQAGVCSAIVFLDERRFLSATQNGWRLFDAALAREVGAFEGAMPTVTSAPALSPDGRLLAVGVSTPDTFTREGLRIGGVARVSVWEVASGTLRYEFLGHEGPVSAVTFSPDCRVMASGGNDTTILLWDLQGPPAASASPPQGPEVEQLVQALGSRNAREAEAAIRRLQQVPEPALNVLRRTLRPVEGRDASDAAIRTLLEGLNANRFAVREKAARELELLGRRVLPQLQQLQKSSPPLEVSRRVERLLEAIERSDDAAQYLPALRGIELLERLGTPAAKMHLQQLAGGMPGAVPTMAANAALGRWK